MNSMASYTAASTIPVKLLCNEELVRAAKTRALYPHHIQFNPTNKCPYNCSFCSCAKRDRTKEMGRDRALATLNSFCKLGTKAVTITGGGDPLAWSPINDFIRECYQRHVVVGLTTNGVLANRLSLPSIFALEWVRISVSSHNRWPEGIEKFLAHVPSVGISYVVVGNRPAVDAENLEKLLDAFGKFEQLTHIRVVENILDSSCASVADVQNVCKCQNEKIIWQGRKSFEHGSERCLVSLLKPNITPEGFITPCCGIQYADEPAALDFADKYKMGTVEQIKEIWEKQKFFDGSVCKRCYYSDYNNILGLAWDADSLQHTDFV